MPSPRAHYHHGDLAAALLDAAETILVRDGAGDLRLRQVALEVGVAPSAAYHHFADRAALIDALGVRALDALARAVEERLARPAVRRASAIRRLQALGHAYISWARKEPARFAIAFGPERAAEGVTSNRRPYHLLENLLDEAVADGTLDPGARRIAERALWPAIHGVAVLAAAGPLKNESDRALLARIDEMVATILAGASACTSPEKLARQLRERISRRRDRRR